ncbi:alpha/beta-hydrolase [Hortaea werneckii]|nr:alpha/beta-hydrolase [Hortaea werneckii]
MRGDLLSVSTCLYGLARAVQPVVNLDYSSYRGTSLPNGVTQWLGIRYAAPPLGDLRFAAPQAPLSTNGTVIDADAHGPICLGTDKGPPTNESSEDCLFMDIYAPSNTTKWSKLPVFFFIQGGGFNTNSNANYNGSGLIEASDMNIVVVNFNYRVGPYGFLAGREVTAGGSVNNGLKDQRAALHWVQKYIHHFGGDECHVTMGGDSAGAQSVNLHVTAYGGRDDGLFHATAAESQSFSALRTISESQFSYDNLVIRTGCASSVDTLACLRSLTATELQEENFNTPFPGAQNPPLYMYGPVLDFDFITDYTYRAYAQGAFVRLPSIAGDDTNEGTIFTPKNTSSIGESDTFMKDNFPAFALPQLRRWNELYPVEGTPTFPDAGRYWRQVSQGYGELRYICPGIFISGTQANMSLPNWNYRWNVIDPPAAANGNGVSHTIEVNAIWGPSNTNGGAPDSYQQGGLNYPIVDVVQGYWTSFIRCYDPNTHRLPGSPELTTPTWRPFRPTSKAADNVYSFSHDVFDISVLRAPENQVYKKLNSHASSRRSLDSPSPLATTILSRPFACTTSASNHPRPADPHITEHLACTLVSKRARIALTKQGDERDVAGHGYGQKSGYTSGSWALLTIRLEVNAVPGVLCRVIDVNSAALLRLAIETVHPVQLAVETPEVAETAFFWTASVKVDGVAAVTGHGMVTAGWGPGATRRLHGGPCVGARLKLPEAAGFFNGRHGLPATTGEKVYCAPIPTLRIALSSQLHLMHDIVAGLAWLQFAAKDVCALADYANAMRRALQTVVCDDLSPSGLHVAVLLFAWYVR